MTVKEFKQHANANDGTYTVCNRWTVNRTLEKDNGAAIMATTLSYAKE